MARPPSATYRFQKAFRRNKLAFAAAAGVAAALVLGVAVSTWQAVRALQAERVAKQKSSFAEQQQRRAETGETAARESELVARQNLYASDMNLALQAVEAKNLGFALELVNRHRPRPG